MVYSFELIKHANIRYRDSLVVLSRCELFAMLWSLGVTAEIREETLGGSRFLTVECRDLNESEIAFLSGHSSFCFMSENRNGLLRPLPVSFTGYLPEDLPEVLKYKGKTIRDLGSDIRRRPDSRPERLRRGFRGGYLLSPPPL